MSVAGDGGTEHGDLDRGELEDARDLMLMAAAVLTRWEWRLRQVADRLPDPQYADDTDDPLNLAAAIQGLLQVLLDEEIQSALQLLRRAAAWVEDPSTWQGPPSSN